MDDTIADYVTAAVAPHVPRELISNEALADIRHVAALLPGPLTDFFGFECRLGTDEATADFLVCCRIRHGSREILAGRRSDCSLRAALQDHPVWRRIRAFSEAWDTPASLLHDAVHNIWLEFDIDGTRDPIPVPNVFIGSERLGQFDRHPNSRRMPPECEWLTDVALPMLLGGALDGAVRENVAWCLNHLPSSGCVFQVGLMLARESPITRVCVRGVAPEQIVAYLTDLAWEGTCDGLASFLALLQPKLKQIDIDLDLAERVLPKIGFECYDRNPPDESEFLAYLVSSELCTARKAQAMATWPGISQLQGRGSAFERAVHHIKVDYQAATATQAKAYLGLHQRWLPADAFPSRSR
jgi:hypothetical protein